jgi:hypothetical protein
MPLDKRAGFDYINLGYLVPSELCINTLKLIKMSDTSTSVPAVTNSNEPSPREKRALEREKSKDLAGKAAEKMKSILNPTTGYYTPEASPEVEEARIEVQQAETERINAEKENQLAQNEKHNADADAMGSEDAEKRDKAAAKTKAAEEKAEILRKATEKYNAAKEQLDAKRKVATQEAEEAASRTRIEIRDNDFHLTKLEIERVLSSSDDEYKILDLEEDADADEIEDCWITVGCDLHPEHCKIDGSKEDSTSE